MFLWLQNYDSQITMGLFSRKPKGDAVDWYNKGVLYDNQGDTKNAMKCYDRVLEIDPNLAEAWYAKGALYDNQGDTENAMKCKDKARELGYTKKWQSNLIKEPKKCLDRIRAVLQ